MIALLGAPGSGREALLLALQPRLQSTGLLARVIEDADAWAAALQEVPALVLLLAPRDAAGEAHDAQWRALLAHSGLGFSVLHGDLPAQLDGAMRLIDACLRNPSHVDATENEGLAPRWSWCCDTCSDATCERRLFKDLLQKRGAGATTAGSA